MDGSNALGRPDGPADDLPATIRELQRADARLAAMEARLWTIIEDSWGCPTAGWAGDIGEATAGWSLKSELLASIGHELRTPMQAVLGMTSSVLSADVDAERERRARTIRDSGDALLRVLDGITYGGPGDSEGAPPTLDPVVIEDLRALAQSETGFLDEIVWLFTNEVGLKVADLETAFAAGDRRAVQLVAHEVNGCAGQVGATAVAATCRRIEVGCAAGALADCGSDVAALRGEFNRARAALRSELSSAGSAGRAA